MGRVENDKYQFYLVSSETAEDITCQCVEVTPAELSPLHHLEQEDLELVDVRAMAAKKILTLFRILGNNYD